MQPRRHRMRGQARRESSRAWIASGATVTIKTYARRYGVDRYTACEDLTAIGFPLPDSARRWEHRPPPQPRRACRTGHHGRAVHGLADPQERRDRSGAPPGRPGLGRVPAVPGAGDPGAGLLHRRPAQRSQDLCPGRHRARLPPRPGPWRHRAPRPGLGRAAGTEPADGLGGHRDAGCGTCTRSWAATPSTTTGIARAEPGICGRRIATRSPRPRSPI